MEAVGGDSGGVGGDSARKGAGPGRIINYRTDPFIRPVPVRVSGEIRAAGRVAPLPRGQGQTSEIPPVVVAAEKADPLSEGGLARERRILSRAFMWVCDGTMECDRYRA